MATIEEINRFLDSPMWSDQAKAVIKWQFRLLGDFHTALWQAIAHADERNLSRLERGFPVEVQGYRAWAHGNLAKQLRTAGLDI